MSDEFECGVTASFLKSGQSLATASHVATIVAGYGIFAQPSPIVRMALTASLLCWMVQCWYAVRVRIDASLFQLLAEDSQAGAERLDETLHRWGFVATIKQRSVADRSRGALRLWRRQIAAFGGQLLGLFTGVAASFFAR